MAENDVLKNELAAQSGSATTPAGSIPTGNTSLDTYNAGRESQIRDVYGAARQNNLAALQTAYDQNLSNAQANRDKIIPQYQDSMNQLSAEYERQRRNNNLQAQANGLNTGAGSQMQLGQMNVYNQGQAGMQRQMNEALDTADRGILDLKTDYQNQISQAAANNDYQLAAALLDEYGDQYQRQMDQAQQLAQFGDFSLYTNIYGADAAKNMETSWMLQNPDLAWTLGKITREQYFSMTGKWPHDATGGGGGGGGGSRYGASSTPQGYYSSGTVANIQRQLGVTADGMAGPNTYAALQAGLASHPEYQNYINKWYNT